MPFRAAGFHSLRTILTSRPISAEVPMVMRTKPLPMSLLRSRSKIPCLSSLRNSARPIAVHGKSGLADQNACVRFDEGIEKDAQGVVASVGEQQLFRVHAEITCK